MKSWGKALLYGFCVWLIPFVVAIVISPLRASHRPLFESLMPVAVTASVVVFAVLYLRKLQGSYLREGVFLGALWFLVSVGIDLPMTTAGPMKMSFTEYMMDIGLTYLIIPTVTVGMGYLLTRKP